MTSNQSSAPHTSDILVEMRDGVKLATTLHLPSESGTFPVALVRTPYDRKPWNEINLLRRGMAFVVQDTRGRYDSEGEFYPWSHEEHDGLDTLDWIAAQPWCNGRIGMFGDSYLAGTQFALAAPGHPALVALNPRFMFGDMWQHGFYCDGVFSLALTFSWLCLEVGVRVSRAQELPSFNVPEVVRHLPLATLDERLNCGEVPVYRDYLAHETKDSFWQVGNWRDTLGQTSAPVLQTAGWYDYYAGETFLNFAALLKSENLEIRAGHRLLVGPWTHGISPVSQLGELDFGPAALEAHDSTERWLECVLKEDSPARYQEAPIRIFVMGANVWRDEWEWPLQRTEYICWFLHADGALSQAAPQDENPDTYLYDPENPVPTLGGNHSIGPYNPGLYELALPGPYDQRPTEARDDVLVYTSEVLQQDTEITGPVTMHLFATSSAPDTDFVARLCDVYPDGRSMNITEGVIRARFHERKWDSPQLLEPATVYEFIIDMQATSNVFKAGHRIRLQITSSNFPLWNRNLNTGEPLATGIACATAEQTIFHSAEFPSHLTLPFIPG